MADYDIDRSAAAEAAALLRNLLQTEVPQGDFTEGSATSDLLIDGHAIITGYLRKQISVVRQRQSLLTLAALPASESVSDAADAILDNFFRSRRQGNFAIGAATLRFSARQDIFIPRTSRFYKTATLAFYVDSTTDVFIPASDLRADIDTNGLISSYSTNVYLKAERVGTAYNISPGAFVAFDRFNALLLSVENLATFGSGTSVQTTSDFIAKSRNAIALRALINERSNDALLLDRFIAIESTTTVGYGDPEMMRDRVANVSNSVTLHVGGHMDIFVRQDIQEGVEQLVVGEPQTRNDGRALTLRHSAISSDSSPAVTSFLSAGVIPGDILRVSGLPEGLFEFVITAVRATEIDIALRTPFSIATDELSSPTPLSYSIGNVYPAFDDKVIVATPTTNATTSRRFTEFNRFQLPAGPVYDIRSVELVAPVPTGLLAYADSLSGNVNFTARKNAVTITPPATSDPLGFYVTVKNPLEAQSNRAITMVELGWPTVDLTGATVNITYEMPVDFDAVDTYVSSRMNRPGCSNTLARAYHPIYLYVSIPYRPRTTPFDPLSTVIPVFDSAAAALSMTYYLNNYRETEPLDVSLIATQARATSTAIAAIYSFMVSYDFILPDGRVMAFETDDKVTIFPDGVTNGARLMNPADFGLPRTGYYAALRKILTDLGVSDRVTRYRVSANALTFDRRA